MSDVPALLLNDGHHIPQLGFGTWQIPADETAAAVRVALETGYRHLDTAQMYRNERGVGEGIRAAGVPREEVFLTTKLGNDAHLPADAERAFERSLVELGTDYVDLFLIHWPMIHSYGGDYATTWRVLEGFRADGRARSIGVSNFRVVDLERLRVETEVVPAVNQIEAHPFFPNDEVREYDQAHGIVTEAWSPLAQADVLDDTVVRQIAKRIGRAPSQVVLRWHLQRGDVVFPKSVTPARIRENFDVLGFELDLDDMALLASLDRGPAGRTGPDPNTFDYRPT